jgi:F-type H+-transporting ATPase subunit b
LPIDWFTVAAQAVNFVILVALLTRFLYRPLTRVIAERDARVSELLDDAARRAAEADERARRLEEEERGLAVRRRDAFEALEEEIESQRAELLERAREGVARREREWHEALGRRRGEILDGVASSAVSHLADALRAALDDLAGAELDERLVAAFLARFDALDDRELAAFVDDIGRSDALVRSAHPLGVPLRDEILRRLERRLGRELALRFEVDVQLVCGIDLSVGGWRLAWNAEQYVADLEDELRRHLVAEPPGTAFESERSEVPATSAAGGESEESHVD